MQHDVYRPGDHRDYDRSRDKYGRGPPSRGNDRNDQRHNNDQRHPYEWYRSRSQTRSPPRRRAPSPRLDGDIYRFSGNARANGVNGTNGDSSHGDFTFRSGEQRDFYRGPPPSREPPRGPRGQRGRNDRRPQGRQNFQPRRFGPKPAHERQILHADNDREGTPERLMGMKEGASKFKPVDDLFISDSDDDSPMDLESPDTEDGPSTKRLKTGDDDDAAALAEEKPKWSNPDPYYLIPPLDESRGKRKDVVHLLRKAKVETEKSGGVTNAVSRNADFIGFSDEDEQEFARDGLSEEGEIDSDQHMQPDGNRDSGAQPKTARNGTSATSLQPAATLPAPGSSFSHRQNLHQLSETNIMVAQDVAIQPTPRQETADIDVLDEARALLQQYKEEATVQSQKQKNDATQQGKKRKLDADGGITKPWTAKDRASSAPWHIDHSAASSTTFWLHKEICDFYDFIRPRAYEARIRQDLIDRLQRVLSRAFAGARIYAFGSYGQDIYLPTSDMDLVMLSDEFERRGRYGFAKKALFKIANDLQSARITTREDTQVIHRAKVPIVKFVDTLTGLHCDLSLDNDSGLHALTTFEKWRRTWPFLPKLLSVLKQWLLMRDMNEVFSGGLGGFSLTCMVVSMLQRMPSSQTAHIDGGGRLGELLLEFFHLYGNKFNMDNVGISLNPAEYFDKGEYGIGKFDRWTIIDPNNEDNDLSGGSSQARLIQKRFSEAHAVLTDTMRTLDTAGPVLRKGRSILQLVIGGNYESMLLQRGVLREVYKKNIGPVDESATQHLAATCS